ncbi:MAG: bile acid:sodium symporter family protein [Myxococcota bacterium]
MEFTEVAGPVVLFLLMLAIGLELTPADFRRVFETPRAVVGGTLGQWILLPLMTWVVVTAVGVTPVFGAGAILVAVTPGAGISNVLVAFGRGNIALSVSLTATASAFAVVTLPLLSSLGIRLFLDDPPDLEIPVVALTVQLALTLLLPIALGMTLRTRYPAESHRLAPRLHRVTVAAAVGFVLLAVLLAPDEQVSFEGSERALAAAFLWALAAMAIGWGVAAALRLEPEDRFTFLIEFSARNVGVSSIVAMSGLGRLDLTLFSGIYVAVAYPLAVLAVFLRRRA